MRGGRRLVSLGIVTALHVAIVAALLTLSHEKIAAPGTVPNEELIWLLPLPPEKTVVTPRREREPPPRAAITMPRNPLPDYRGITIPNAPPAPSPSLDGLHGSLFGCADLDKLSPEERTRCGSALAVPDNSVDFLDGVNRSRPAALWERGRLRKNGPLLLPCMSSRAAGADLLGTAFCLAKGAVAGGFKPDEQPSYADPRTVMHLPNNGDPPDKPTGF